jgi:hypothetical protein
MFRMRSEQKQAFRADALHDFEERVVLHVGRCFAERRAALGDDGLRALIRLGIERAGGHGIVAERDVCKFVDLMLVFGADFDRRCPWARESLDGGTSPEPPSARLRRLYRRAMEEA